MSPHDIDVLLLLPFSQMRKLRHKEIKWLPKFLQLSVEAGFEPRRYKCPSFNHYSRIDAFELWCWRRLLRIPWTARRSNQSILKEISPEYSLEGLMLKVKLQYFGHLMQRANSVEKILMLGKIEGGRRRGQQRVRRLDGITDSMDMSLSKPWEIVRGGKPGVL